MYESIAPQIGGRRQFHRAEVFRPNCERERRLLPVGLVAVPAREAYEHRGQLVRGRLVHLLGEALHAQEAVRVVLVEERREQRLEVLLAASVCVKRGGDRE